MGIKQKLRNMAHPTGQEYASTLEQFVAAEILENLDGYAGKGREQLAAWFRDLWQGGCQSGFVTSLIYYSDTHKFFDKFYDEIDNMRDEYESEMGEPLAIPSCQDLKNWLAWFAFETTARNIEAALD